MTELDLGDLTVEMKADDGETIKEVLANRQAIESLMNKCYSINIEEKKLKSDLALKKDELKTLLNSLSVTKIITEKYTMSNIPTKRFNGWEDEEALLQLIPENLRGLQTMIFDRKKIEALIKSKEIPKELKKPINDLMIFNDTKSIRFTPAGKGFVPDTD